MLSNTASIIIWLFMVGPLILILLSCYEGISDLKGITKKGAENNCVTIKSLKIRGVLFFICAIKNVLTYVFSFGALLPSSSIVIDNIAWILYCLFPFELCVVLAYQLWRMYKNRTPENTKHIVLAKVLIVLLGIVCLILILGVIVFILGIFAFGF